MISTFTTRNEENPDICTYCDERHKLEGCNSFMEKTLKERTKFLAKQKSCCGCLKPMTEGHNAKICTQQLTCCSCKRNHPAPLHGYTPNKKSKTDGNKTVNGGGNLKNNFAGLNNDLMCADMTGKTGSKVISMCIIPVKVKHGMVKM